MSESYSTSSVWQSRMDYGAPRRPDEGSSKIDELDSELWHACAGPLTSLPPLESVVVYWPQGHIEQVVACTPESVGGEVLEKYKLPPHIYCKIGKIELKSNPQTDEVYAQMDLNPVDKKNITPDMEEPPPLPKHKNVHMFCKTLTASDTSTHGGFSVPRRAAEECLPLLDYSMNPPCQELVAKDLHGVEWKFRHIYRGHPRRHLLTTGWSVFVSSKRLVAGDSVLFLRGENGQLRVGIRRATMKQLNERSSFFCSLNLHLGVIAAATHAAKENLRFSVVYNPRTSPSEFVIPYHKFIKAENAVKTTLTVGSRFKMRFESEESAERRYSGTITGLGDADTAKWPHSLWRSVKVEWDESAASERHERVSPWEIEPFVPLSNLPPPSAGPRIKRRPPTLVTDLSPLGTSQSALDPFQSNKLARILQGHDPRNVGTSMVDEEEGDAESSQAHSWVVKREPVKPGMQSWFRHPDNLPVSDIFCGLQGGVQRPEYSVLMNLDSGNRSLEREKQHLKKLRDQHKDMSATSLQLSPKLSSVTSLSARHCSDNGDLQPPANSACMEKLPSSSLTSVQWTGVMGPPNLHSGSTIPLREPSCSMIPSWLTTNKPSLLPNGTACAASPGIQRGVLLPSTSPNIMSAPKGCPVQTLSIGMWDQAEMEQISNAAPPVEQQCKLFGFDLTDKSAPVNVSARARCEDSEASGSWHGPDQSGPGCVDQQTTKHSSGGSQGQSAPVRSGTKVYQHGKVGRSIDLKKFDGYAELRHTLATLFNLEGQLDDATRGWILVYTDLDNDVLLVGDDPWEEFYGCVRSIKILSPEEAAALGKYATSIGDKEDERGCAQG